MNGPEEPDVRSDPIVRSTSRWPLYASLLLIGIQIGVALTGLPFLPHLVPIHWGINGEVNQYTNKWIGISYQPLISIMLFFVFRGAARWKPLLTESIGSTQKFNEVVLVAMLVLMLSIQILTIAAALHYSVDVSLVVTIGVGLLFVLIGNYMTKLRRNFWSGIKTSWTLANDTVWERTHRLGAQLFTLCGIFIILSAVVPVPQVRLIVLLTCTIGIVAILYIYSYLVFRRVERPLDLNNPDHA